MFEARCGRTLAPLPADAHMRMHGLVLAMDTEQQELRQAMQVTAPHPNPSITCLLGALSQRLFALFGSQLVCTYGTSC